MKYAAAALLGLTNAGRIPIERRELTKDMVYGQMSNVADKFLGGEKI
jgi:hypothetical protein